MEYRQLANTDLKVSVVGLGGNTFGPPRLALEQSVLNMRRAQELGVNFLDTANGYGEGQSEVHVGQAIKGHRKHWLIATKFNVRNLKEGETIAQRIRDHAETSLRRMHTDYIDLLQIHQPSPTAPEEEILEPLAKLVQEGKVRYIGECNYASWRHAVTNAVAEKNGWPIMVSSQNHYNILHRHVELEILPYCEKYNIAFLPYFPLGGGFLTGKYRPGQPPPPGSRGAEGSGIMAKTRNARNEAILLKLEDFCASRGHTVLELAFGWLLAHKCIPSVIAGTSSPEQVEANVKAGNWKLTPEEVAEVNEIAAWDGTAEATDSASGDRGAPVGARAGRGQQPAARN